ncbi:MAG: hypothetical protein KGJ78_12465 [Alphaproteobacteria bacterium]|nr:hypothetical protein [Alphaproteobacteria bacterium]
MSVLSGRARTVIAALLAAASCAGIADARPSMSRGEQFLNITEAQCLHRAELSYEAAGWVDIASGSTWVKAHKDHYGSFTACNADASGGVVVNIFVAYDLSDPTGDLAGGERTRLQSEMNIDR